RGIVWAERALSSAARLGLPEPPIPLGHRGVCRALLGDADGLVDMRRALSTAVDEGLGRAAAVLYNNLSLALWQIEGPGRALDALSQGIAFAEARGVTEQTQGMAQQSL